RTTWSCVDSFPMKSVDPCREKGPRLPELGQFLVALIVQRIHLARRTFLRGDLLDVDQCLFLDPHQHGIHGAFGDLDESLVPQPDGDLVAIGGASGQEGEDDALENSLEHLRPLVAHRTCLMLGGVVLCLRGGRVCGGVPYVWAHLALVRPHWTTHCC